MTETIFPSPSRIASREEWRAAREALPAEEKALSRELDRLAERRRALPWVPVEKDHALCACTTAMTADGRRGRPA